MTEIDPTRKTLVYDGKTIYTPRPDWAPYHHMHYWHRVNANRIRSSVWGDQRAVLSFYGVVVHYHGQKIL